MSRAVLSSAEQTILKQQELVAALQALARHVGPNVTLVQFERESGLSRTPVYRWLRSWARLRVAADLPPWRRRDTQEELEQHLGRIVEERGDVSQRAFCRERGISTSTLSGDGPVALAAGIS